MDYFKTSGFIDPLSRDLSTLWMSPATSVMFDKKPGPCRLVSRQRRKLHLRQTSIVFTACLGRQASRMPTGPCGMLLGTKQRVPDTTDLAAAAAVLPG